MPLVSAGVWYDDNLHTGPRAPERHRRTRPYTSQEFTANVIADFVLDPGSGVVDVSDLASLHSYLASSTRYGSRVTPARWRDVNPTEIRLLEPDASVGNAPWAPPPQPGVRRLLPRRPIQGVSQEFDLGLPKELLAHVAPADTARRRPDAPRGGGAATSASLQPADLLSAWPDLVAVDVYGAAITGPGTGSGDNWFAATATSLRRRLRNRSDPHAAPPELFAGLNTLAYVHHWQHPLQASPRGRNQGRLSLPERHPDLPEELIVTLAAVEAHRLPVPRRVGPSSPPAYLDPGEFRTIVAWEMPSTTFTRGPVARRGMAEALPLGFFVADPELTAHITADAALPPRPLRRAAPQAVQGLPLDSDFLGPLPAVFVASPAPPTRLLPHRPAPTDGTLRDLPDATASIEIAWHTLPQAPTRPLFRAPPEGAGGVRGVWFATLQADEFLAWGGIAQPPSRALPRRPVEGTAYASWAPVGDPMAWDVGPQPRQLRRPVPTAHEYIAAPPIHSSGASIVVPGPYYCVAGQIYSAGAITGQVTTE